MLDFASSSKFGVGARARRERRHLVRAQRVHHPQDHVASAARAGAQHRPAPGRGSVTRAPSSVARGQSRAISSSRTTLPARVDRSTRDVPPPSRPPARLSSPARAPTSTRHAPPTSRRDEVRAVGDRHVPRELRALASSNRSACGSKVAAARGSSSPCGSSRRAATRSRCDRPSTWRARRAPLPPTSRTRAGSRRRRAGRARPAIATVCQPGSSCALPARRRPCAR